MTSEQITQETARPLPSHNANRPSSPMAPGLRHRPSLRTVTVNDTNTQIPRRKSSFFSDNVSETHRSLRSSTDDLLLPRVAVDNALDDSLEISHWHSVPLGLALLPAVGGLFFKDGSAIITDVTLLGLAAIFLNWSLRLPWEVYKSAQEQVVFEPESPSLSSSMIAEEDEDSPSAADDDQFEKPIKSVPAPAVVIDEVKQAAQKELRVHEILALGACFAMPALGAWLLHAIRSQLSRPSEGLVSNYNLTVFLLVAELRPLSHLVKMAQRRTLFLQRKVNASFLQDQKNKDKSKVTDLSKRLEELEAHIANDLATVSSQAQDSAPPDTLIAELSSQATSDMRRTIQPELDALNRAMRRYEKRMTISAIQVEARLQELETRLKDVVVLAAAAQRNADRRPQYAMILANWVCAIFVIPMRYIFRLLSLPTRIVQSTLDLARQSVGYPRRQSDIKDGRTSQRGTPARPRSAMKKTKSST